MIADAANALHMKKNFSAIFSAAVVVSAICTAALAPVAPVSAFRQSSHTAQITAQIARDSDIVAFNTSNYKFHALSCIWAERCTVHCIQITRKEAHKRGGIPCKVCGGGE